MKKLYILLASVVLVSCSKSTDTTQSTTTSKAFVRIECVEPSGESTYSQILVVNIK